MSASALSGPEIFELPKEAEILVGPERSCLWSKAWDYVIEPQFVPIQNPGRCSVSKTMLADKPQG